MFLAHLASQMLAPTSVGKEVFHVCASLAQFSACSEKLFKRIFQGCCLLFNYQGSLFSQQLYHSITCFSACQELFYFIFQCVSPSCDSSYILSQALSVCQQLFLFF